MKNYSKKYFGKTLNELSYENIVDFFIEEKEESDKIEFKAFHPDFGNFNKNFEGVIRGICGFLNSNGGILIWGAPLGKKIDEKIIFQGDLSLVTEFKEKDAVISKVSDSITPLPININVEILENAGKYLYIFEVQTSNYSPHQFKNTYWARLDGQTKPAPHYLVEALFKKISYPNIEGYINFEKFGSVGDNCFIDISIMLFNFSELQNEENIVYRVTSPQAIFADSLEPDPMGYYELNGHQFVNNDIKILHYGSPERHQERLLFNWEELGEKHNNELEVFFFFGGKNSPLKLSEYTLALNGTVSTNNVFEKIKELRENELASEIQERLGNTKEIILKKMLKR